MIRPLIFIVLLGASPIVLAEPLYKWVEPDGAITFSVTPPPAGIDYETISSSPADTATISTPGAEPAQMAPSAEKSPSKAVQLAPSIQRVAPRVSAAQPALPPGIQRSTPMQQNNNLSSNTTGIDKGGTDSREPTLSDLQRRAAMMTKTRKQRQCEDLKKRVVSLEGRLRNRLTPADMDNTVVHMARYQRSYDQHCVQ